MLEGFPLYFWEFLILNLPLYRLLMSKINYSFPRGIGTNDAHLHQPYMLLTSYESKNAIQSTTNSAGGAIIKSSIALYIPPNALKTGFDAEYGNAEGGATKAAFGGALGRVIGRGGDAGIAETLFAAVKGTGLSAGGALLKQAEKGTGMLAAQGIAVNNHMALTYKGPSKFRTHEFSFSFFPKNEPEAQNVRRILEDFENGMLPRMGGGMDFAKIKGRKLSQPIFQSPRHWTIDFYTKKGALNKYLFQIGKSVITTMSVNHDPSSTVSLHEGTGSPVQTVLGLTFQEIELQVSSDESIVIPQADDGS